MAAQLDLFPGRPDPFKDPRFCYHCGGVADHLGILQQEHLCAVCHWKQEEEYLKDQEVCPLEVFLWGRVHDKNEKIIGGRVRLLGR